MKGLPKRYKPFDGEIPIGEYIHQFPRSKSFFLIDGNNLTNVLYEINGNINVNWDIELLKILGKWIVHQTCNKKKVPNIIIFLDQGGSLDKIFKAGGFPYLEFIEVEADPRIDADSNIIKYLKKISIKQLDKTFIVITSDKGLINSFNNVNVSFRPSDEFKYQLIASEKWYKDNIAPNIYD